MKERNLSMKNETLMSLLASSSKSYSKKGSATVFARHLNKGSVQTIAGHQVAKYETRLRMAHVLVPLE